MITQDRFVSSGAWIEQFPGNLTWSNAALVTKGMAPYGAVALGEIDEVFERLKARQGEADAWREEWCAMARRLECAADAAAAEGRQLTESEANIARARFVRGILAADTGSTR